MNEKEEHIKLITEEFFKYGIKSMSMDDIARLLGMSKKTLYQNFKDKNEIVSACVALIKKEIKIIFDKINDSNKNFIEKEVERFDKILKSNKAIKPTFIFDLRKFYPTEFNDLISFKNDLAYKNSFKHIEEGQSQGFVRRELSPDFVAKYRITLANAIFESEVSAFTEDDIMSGKYNESLLKHGLHAVCTPRGIEEFYRLMEETK